MKLNYDNLIEKTSRFKSVTGLSKEEFDYLVLTFEDEWNRFMGNYTF